MTTFFVDAFVAPRGRGNPAAIVPLDTFFDDSQLQSIAKENDLPITSFLVRGPNSWALRWFTTTGEIPLCGHGTIASAWVISNRLDPGCVDMVFETKAGRLPVRRTGERYVMNFPARHAKPVAADAELAAALGAAPLALYHDGVNYLALLHSAAAVRALTPDIRTIARYERVRGLIVTAAGDDGYDCVSRYFTPQQGIAEDAVTGSAHCTLTPFWCERLGKREIAAFQASSRGGELVGRLAGDRVELEGACREALGAGDAVDLDAGAAG